MRKKKVVTKPGLTQVSEDIHRGVPPEKFTNGKVSAPSSSAAGAKGVAVALKHLTKEVGADAVATVMPKMNQFDGFDCPGCAWPDPDEKRSFLGEYCENGAKAIAEESTKKKADPTFWQNHSLRQLVNFTDYELGKSGRITQPMYLPKGGTRYEPIAWDKAFEIIAKDLNELPTPDDAIFYTSGRTSNEAAYLYQLFVRNFGTNNLPDCSNMCHESSGVALTKTLGLGKGSVKLEDFNKAEVILIMGQNPGTNHPRMLSALEEAKAEGAKIVSVNPLKEPGLLRFKNPQGLSMLKSSAISDHYLQVKINGDLALLKAIIYLLLQKEEKKPNSVFDNPFILQHTDGYDALMDHIKKQDINDLVAQSGLRFHEIEQVANLIAEKKRIIICWAMGITQHHNGVETIQEIVNLLLLKGSIGKPGAGTCPVRGHSNVQGDRTMGIYEKPKPEFIHNLNKLFGKEFPKEAGLDVVEAIEKMHQEKGKVFIAMGGNFLSATPDTLFTAKALQNCKLTVHVSTKPNRSHLIHGEHALILPCLGRSEEDVQKDGVQFVTVENSMGVVHQSNGDLKPVSEHLKSETRIIAELASKTFGSNDSIDWLELSNNYNNIRDLIAQSIDGFHDFNARVRQKGGFYLPNGPRELNFTTPNKKANFTVNQLQPIKVEQKEYLLMTIRSHDQFNTTIYGLDDRYRGVYNERRVLFMHPNDIEKEGFISGEVVNLTSHFKDKKRFAYRFVVVPYDIPEGNTAAYFPETNVLVPIDSTAAESNTPTSKGIRITIQKA